MAKYMICNHDEKHFCFTYKSIGTIVKLDGIVNFTSVIEFEEAYNNHDGPLFPIDHFYKAMEIDNCFGKFQDLSDVTIGPSPVKEFFNRMQAIHDNEIKQIAQQGAVFYGH
jgi:hypothetical protein